MEIQGKRAVAVIIKNNQILLMRRIKNDQQYFVFPGGSVEKNENPEDTVVRELQEEFTLDISITKELFQIINTVNDRTRKEYYYLIDDFTGTPILGGEEKDRMTDENQYSPQWVKLTDLPDLTLFPEESKQKIIKLFL